MGEPERKEAVRLSEDKNVAAALKTSRQEALLRDQKEGEVIRAVMATSPQEAMSRKDASSPGHICQKDLDEAGPSSG